MMSESPITLLFVAFEFPPLGGAGVQRSMKWATYLPHFGIRPIVLTVAETDVPFVMPGHRTDPGLLEELPKGLIIERVPCRHPRKPRNRWSAWADIFFSVSESFKDDWKPALQQALPGIIKKYKPDAVYVSLPPFAMATLWRELLAEYRLPLIVDFRDAWSQWCVNVNGTYLHYWLKRREERRILKRSDAVICSSSQIRADMISTHPGIPPGKFSVITNGYDGHLPETMAAFIPDKPVFVIGYVGSFYYTPESRDHIFRPWWKKPPHRMLNYTPRREDWLYRSPYFFFQTLNRWFDAHPEWRSRIEIRFAGITPDWLEPMIQSFGLSDRCRHYGYLPHREVIRFQQECDALLLTSSKVIGGRDYSIAGKTFEYFTIGKPILAFVAEGVQKDLLAESGLSVGLDPDDPIVSARTLQDFFEGRIRLSPNQEALARYHRKPLAGQLADIIRRAVSSTLQTDSTCAA